MNISKINSPNFQARMDISNVKKYRYYWQEVADNFAKKTAGKDEIVTLQEEIYGLREFKVTTSKKRCLGYIIYDKNDALINEPPQIAAKKISQVFNKFMKVTTEWDNSENDDVNKIFEENNDKLITVKTLRDLFERALTKKEQMKNDINSKLSNSKDLNGFKIII